MLDRGLLATVSLTSSYVLADSPDQVDPYLDPRVWVFLSIVCTSIDIEAVKSTVALAASSPS
jgi:hypothetical protein